MLEWLLPLLPMPTLAAFAALAVGPGAISSRCVRLIAAGAAAVTTGLLLPFWLACSGTDCAVGPIAVTASPRLGGIDHPLGVLLDPLGLVTATTVALVGLMVISFATGFMRQERPADERRLFALLSLFVSAMLTLVIAADALVLFLGWELVGLCSFFLIAYDTQSARSVAAGRKAFVMTRIADAALLAGLALLFVDNNTIRLAAMTEAVRGDPTMPGFVALLLILFGALGKSAQIPLQTWLPDAMAGPVPVSALLHSATMVSAGMFLLARFSPVITAMPLLGWITACIGLATVLLGGLAALAQTDIKRLLAYSTISQIGYMIMAVGVGATGAALAHFVMHAAFKSLLFIAAGLVIEGAGDSRDIADLRGARQRTPIAFWCFAAGALSLAGVPFLTAGWFSKEAILLGLWSAEPSGPLLWAGASVGAVLTAAYALRPLIILSSAPRQRHDIADCGSATTARRPATAMLVPLIVLSAAALLGGLGVDAIEGFVADAVVHEGHTDAESMLLAAGVAAAAGGALLAVFLTRRAGLLGQGRAAALLRNGLGIDAFYSRFIEGSAKAAIAAIAEDPLARLSTRLVASPLSCLITLTAHDPVGRGFDHAVQRAMRPAGTALVDRINHLYEQLARAVVELATATRRLQTGKVRTYVAAIAFGAATLLGIAVSLAWN